jgi:small-conductance mechanosensitive channel
VGSTDIAELLQLDKLLSPPTVRMGIRIVIVLAFGYAALRLLSIVVGKAASKRLSKQSAMLLEKGILYIGFFLIAIAAMQQAGVKLTALLGAAGIVGIALGFAAQTSVSNIISGLFLIGEKPFAVGDVIRVGERLGTVDSIDLLSVKLRTFDNQLIRLPNESLIKAEVTTITRYPIRRMDIMLGVSYKEDIRRVLEILRELARDNPLVLDEPEPFLMFKGFGDSALEVQYGVWFRKEDFLKLKTELMIRIKERFDEEGIEIPFPHRTLYTGSVTEPFPIRLVESSTSPTGGEDET